MTLFLPRSNRTPGRAANVAAIDNTGAGQAISEFGNVVEAVGRRIEGAQLNYQRNQTQAAFTRELGELAFEVEQMDDPDAIDQRWTSREAEIRDEYLGESSGLDPRVRSALSPGYDELSSRYQLQVGRQALAARNARNDALWMQYSLDVANQGARADAATRQELVEGAAEFLQGLDLEPDEYARRLIALVGEIDNSVALRLQSSDPQALLGMIEAGELDSLGPEAVARYEAGAKATLARAEEAAQKDAEQAEKERQAAIGDTLDGITDIASVGRTAVDEVFLQRPDVQEHPNYPRAMAAVSLRNDAILFERMTPGELDAAIEEERRRPITEKWRNERLEVLEETRDAIAQQWRTNPMTAARERLNVNVPELPLDNAEPGQMLQAITARRRIGEQLAEEGYTDTLTIVDPAERDALQQALDVTADPAARAQLAGELTVALRGDDQSRAALADIITDPVTRHVGGLMGEGGYTRLSTEILRGQQSIENKTAILPPEKDRVGEAARELEAIFASIPGGEAIEAQVRATADALYAGRQRIEGPVDDIDDDAYRQAVHEVLGGSGPYDSGRARGGVQDVRGTPTILPPTMTARQVEETLEAIGRKSAPRGDQVRGQAGATEFSADTFTRQITGASVTGQAPMVGDQALTADVLERLTLEAVGNGLYVLVFPGATRRVVRDADGREFVLDLGKLDREVRR